jgi:hypothetical protein
MPRVADGSLEILAHQLDILAPKWHGSHRRKPEGDNALHKKSKKTKKSVIDNGSAEAPLRGGPLSTTDFDLSEWEILYPHPLDRQCK